MEDEVARRELAAAEKALAAHNFTAAQHLLDNAAASGATPRHIQDLHRRIRAEKAKHEFAVQNSAYKCFGIGILGYLIISIRQPLGWGIPVWLLLSVAAIPGLMGLYMGRKHAGTRSFRSAFLDGVRPAAAAMTCYSLFSLGVLVTHLQPRSEQIGEEIVAAMFTAFVLAVAASVVSGMACAAASRVPLSKG